MANYDIGRAVSALNRNAKTKSSGYCARYVRTAIEAGGLSTAGRPGSAYLYTSFLPKIGFQPVAQLFGLESQAQWTSSSAQVGDISVMSHGQHGHICMWNGRQWVSDFFQRKMWPYSNPANGNCSIFRYTGETTPLSPDYWSQMGTQEYQPSGYDFSQPGGGSNGGYGGGSGVFSASQNNTLTGESIYDNRQKDEEHTRIYQAFKPELLLDQMVVPAEADDSDENFTAASTEENANSENAGANTETASA